MKLIQIGFFRELSYGDVHGESIRDHMGDPEKSDVTSALRYLRAGHPLILAPGISRDVISGNGEIVGPIAILTDGVYAWPREFAYYVEKYGVRIPKDFVSHMRERRWRVPEVCVRDLEV